MKKWNDVQEAQGIRPVQFEVRTISDRLVDVLRDYILSGAISSDVAIRQDALASQLQVSKIPLREALARLEQDGLVVSKPNRGFFVRPLSMQEAEEVYALRLKIEPDAAAYAAQHASPAEQAYARQTLEQLDAAASAGHSTVGALNRAFHLALVRPGGRDITTETVMRLHVMADRYVVKHLEPGGRYVRAEAEHQEIFDAWMARDSKTVIDLITEHLSHTLEDLRTEIGEAERQEEKKNVRAKRGGKKKAANSA